MTRNVNENGVMIPYVDINGTKASFSYPGPKLLNNLPNYMKECTVIDNLKERLKCFFYHCNQTNVLLMIYPCVL